MNIPKMEKPKEILELLTKQDVTHLMICLRMASGETTVIRSNCPFDLMCVFKELVNVAMQDFIVDMRNELKMGSNRKTKTPLKDGSLIAD